MHFYENKLNCQILHLLGINVIICMYAQNRTIMYSKNKAKRHQYKYIYIGMYFFLFSCQYIVNPKALELKELMKKTEILRVTKKRIEHRRVKKEN